MDVERWLEQLPATGPILSSDNTSLVDMAAQADTRETTISTSAPRRSYPTKRRRTDNDNSKRRVSLSPSLISLSECTEPRSSMFIASRQGSPTRDVFNQLRLAKPAIICEPQATGPIPGTVSSPRKRLADRFGQGIIPKGLESRIRESDPDDAEEIPESAYFDSGHMSDAALDVLWNEFEEIRLEARHCDRYGKDENAWCLDVVQPILRKPTEGSSKLQLTSVNNLTRINKKADYALSFSCRDPEVPSLYERVSLGGHGYAISQTTDAFNKRTILFSGVEVKPDDGGKKEALAQLAIWLSGNLEKMRRLGELAKGPLDQADWLLPTIGYWTVVGHDWKKYQRRATINATPATPPTTPPAIAPAWLLEEELFDESEAEVVVAAGRELVDVDSVEELLVAEALLVADAVEEVEEKPRY
ncbi:hypothetical protein ANOM_006773 [Aspergillus nomiae NRRL 13137]|uniref:PD-(D/E)XK nuclease-like domain-containing protein n=1 Tax=Aspergillus nomiae NRRL (strain ATCC 15546 / NRRL 13137 / CBS 260.88 / M93) TaxID=1509407 RepID=A0A0L1IZM6_ASPN3|nr:uncharacterized protein ANOM_006773 [Aspergillus nomiae NRRL 13137]KNG84959.1 hypothetical protein ANOM_006773 [Aspergillus nomiae NRRL 13137]